MSEKKKYTVHRAMHGDGKDYARGDIREMTPIDAADLLATGALSEEGKDPAERDPAVRHTFGQEPSNLNERGYTSASGDGIQLPKPAPTKPARAAAKTA